MWCGYFLAHFVFVYMSVSAGLVPAPWCRLNPITALQLAREKSLDMTRCCPPVAKFVVFLFYKTPFKHIFIIFTDTYRTKSGFLKAAVIPFLILLILNRLPHNHSTAFSFFFFQPKYLNIALIKISF